MLKFNRYFLLTAGVILGVTAIAKIGALFSSAPLMLLPDPLIGLSFRHLLLLAGLLELAIACLCFLDKNIKRNVLLVAWMSTGFLAYRAGLWLIGWHRPCHCLGDLTEMLRMSPEVTDDIMKSILLYLLVGSYVAVFWTWKQARKMPSSSVGGAVSSAMQ